MAKLRFYPEWRLTQSPFKISLAKVMENCDELCERLKVERSMVDTSFLSIATSQHGMAGLSNAAIQSACRLKCASGSGLAEAILVNGHSEDCLTAQREEGGDAERAAREQAKGEEGAQNTKDGTASKKKDGASNGASNKKTEADPKGKKKAGPKKAGPKGGRPKKSQNGITTEVVVAWVLARSEVRKLVWHHRFGSLFQLFVSFALLFTRRVFWTSQTRTDYPIPVCHV